MSEISLIALVIGLTQWVKDKANLQGPAAEVLALVIGFTLGAGSKIAQAAPVDFSGWFAIILYGLAMALVPSGLYKFAASSFNK